MAGEKTALEIANQARPSETEEEIEQVDLLESLGAPITDNVRRLRTEKRAGPGRPAGSRNRRTLEMANYLLSKYTSPLEVLAQIATAPIDELSASLSCTKLEALQEKRLAAIALKDHLHSKMPVAVDVTNRKIIYLRIADDGDDGEGGSGAPAGVGLTDEIIDLTAQDVTPPDGAA